MNLNNTKQQSVISEFLEGNNISNLVELLRYRAENQPNKTAYIFLVDGETEEVKLTYNELDKQAQAIAAKLQKMIQPGERALLLYPPGLEFISAFFGCLYAGIIAVPCYPPDPNRLNVSIAKLQNIITDCTPAVILTTKVFLDLAGFVFPGNTDLKKMCWLATDTVDVFLSDEWIEPIIENESVAYLQYTSGSTGTPKGVMISYANISGNIAMAQEAAPHSERSIFLGWAPAYHDLGLVYHIIYVVYTASLSILMSPIAFLQKPVRWLKAISKYKATTSGGPNFAYDLCVAKISQGQLATLDFSSWDIAFLGAEPSRFDTLSRFSKTFQPCGFNFKNFYHCYGMAEGTLIISAGFNNDHPVIVHVDKNALEQNKVVFHDSRQEKSQSLIGCGRAWLDQKIIIVDSETNIECKPHEVGEIWVSGASVAQGYWNKPELTKETFQAYLSDTGEGPFLRTGDMGFMKNGELFITGRLKDLIIIRGRNHYPQDIELTVEQCHESLRPGYTAAFSIEVENEERPVVVQEIKPKAEGSLDATKVIQSIRKAVAKQHELQVYAVVLIEAKTIPRTSSGKIQRSACKQAFLSDFKEGGLKVIHKNVLDSTGSVLSDSEQIIAGQDIGLWIIAKLSRLAGLDKNQICGDTVLTDLGIDSLILTELIYAIESNCSVDFSVSDLYSEHITINKIVEIIQEQKKPSINSAELTEPPLSFKPRKKNYVHEKPFLPENASRFHRFVNPFLAGLFEDLALDKTFVHGEGCYLKDDRGVSYLDFVAQYGALPFGYNPPEIWDAIQQVRQSLEPSFVQPSILNAAGELAERLLKHTPGLSFVTFANSGTEAVEAAIKICRSSSGRNGILSTWKGFHGKTLGALSATGKEKYQADFGAPVNEFSFVPYGDPDAIERKLSLRKNYYAAVIVEPIQGEAGVIVPPQGYLKKVSEICKKYNTLLIVDEIQTGLGRTGEMFVSIEQGVVPDVITVSKALSGGLIPIGAAICRDEVYNRDFALKHSSTFAGSNLACRAGIAVLDLLERRDGVLLKNVKENGAYFIKELNRLQAKYPRVIKEVRGKGYMIGLKIAIDYYSWRENVLSYLTGQGLFVFFLCSYLLENEHIRLATVLNDENTIRISPPLIMRKASFKKLIEALDRVFGEIQDGDGTIFLEHLLGKRANRPLKNRNWNKLGPIPKVEQYVSKTTRRFAFLVHPLTLKSYRDIDPRLSGFDKRQLATLHNKMKRHVEPFLIGKTFIQSQTGTTACGTFIALPFIAQDIREMPLDMGIERVEEAIKVALEYRPELIGLGAFTSVVTKGGLLLNSKQIPPVTSGSSYTAIAGEVAIINTLKQQGIKAETLSMAVLGATGHVGSIVAMLLAKHSKQLILIGNPAHRDQSHSALIRIMSYIIRNIRETVSVSAVEGTLWRTIQTMLKSGMPDAEVLDHLTGRKSIVLTTSLAKWGPKADVLVTATSDAGLLLNENFLKKGALICELSRPFNVKESIVNSHDYTYIEGGIIEVPGGIDLGFNAGIPPGHVYACMAEVMILTLEGRFNLPLRGHHLSYSTVDEIRKLATRHGYKVK